MGADSIRYFYTGAGADGGSQPDPNSSLGAFRSSTRAPETSFTQPRRISGVRLIWVDPQNLEPASPRRSWFGRLRSPAGTLGWSPSDGDDGPLQFIVPGGDFALPGGANPSQFVEVNVTAAAISLAGGMQDVIEIGVPYRRLFSDVAAAQATAGVTRYRALMVKNVSANPLTFVTFGLLTGWLPQAQVAAVYAGAGAVTIKLARNLDDAGWPASGGAWNVDTDEVVYYSSRTLYTLTVPANGRGFLGSAAAGGAVQDRMLWRPMYTVGDEAPVADEIQSIADEFTAPVGVTFLRAWDDDMKTSLGDLAAGALRGYWLRESIPAGCSSSADHFQGLVIEFDE